MTQKTEVIASPKWVRVFFGGETVVDSRRVKLLRGHGQIPVYYFPREDVQMDWLAAQESDGSAVDQGEGPWPDMPTEAQIFNVKVNGMTAENAAWLVEESEDHPELADHVAFAWPAMDAWYEEDEQVWFHPHDPYHLLDVRHSSRHVKVVVRGKTVAETRRPVLLFEAGLPPRYYIPKTDVQMDLLVESDLETHCAYKGVAAYYSVVVPDKPPAKDLAWYYSFPNYQYAPIQGLIAFPQERVEAFWVDGERLEKS
jgi:uncharacterized protein (DUF427 family)